MTGEQFFVLVTVVIAAIVLIVLAIIHLSKNPQRIKRVILDRLISLKAYLSKPHKSEQPVTESDPKVLTAEEKSSAELERLQKLIEVRKQLARNTDISHHLWSLYKNHFRFTGSQSLDPYNKASSCAYSGTVTDLPPSASSRNTASSRPRYSQRCRAIGTFPLRIRKS
jgi:hypothetical protein